MDRWTELSDRLLSPAIARLGSDARLLELGVLPVAGVVDADALAELCRCAPPTATALTALLADARQRHAVKSLVIAARCVPEPLLRPMLVAAAQTLNPSTSSDFVIPCTLTFGRRRVVTTLIDIATKGSDPLKAGAVNALYWAWAPRECVRWPLTDEAAPPGPPDDPVEDLRAGFLAWAVREFVDNRAIDVRQALVSHIVSARAHEPVLAECAIAIARAHEDSYVRQRLAADLGETRLVPCMPSRSDG